MSTTPRSMSPAEMPHTPEHAAMDQSMMVEPPSQVEHSTQTLQDATIRLHPQGPLDSPPPTQVLNGDEVPNGTQFRGHQQHHRRAQTPETQKRRSDRSEMTSPGHLAPFDWEDFEDRYEKALKEADDTEKQMLEEFGQLVKYFNVWASASSAHDNERAVKRLQTRQRYVALSEQSLDQKKQHRKSRPPYANDIEILMSHVTISFRGRQSVPERASSFTRDVNGRTDIESFHATHFSSNAVGLFESQFLRPDHIQLNGTGGSYDEYEEEDDGLGYYPDGVKRTLTDEQIAIFRHSELEALRRAEMKALKPESASDAELMVGSTHREAVHSPIEYEKSLAKSEVADDTAEGSEDGEIETEKPVLTKAEIRRQKKLRARQRRRENQKFQTEKKPDLRKRTWDIVETGMDSLHYDDLGMSQDHGAASTTQRRQISYDD
ncbi:hypothetical protein NUW58_g7481 [Xylaria curta]|uniref:Uncharacterized protein n=1 Tax=Xylaria curta TaxID=42375 RepID=A0ACC1NHE2_9PEZI|nr:hypothetical protein NUW58_g7481 [Xylaria curta]